MSGNEHAPGLSGADADRGGVKHVVRDTGWAASVTPLLVCAVAVVMIITALGYNPEARRLPILVGVPLAALAALETGLRVRATAVAGRVRDGGGVHEHSASSPWPALGALATFVALIGVFGQVVGTFIFTVGFVRWRGELSVVPALILAVATSALLWLVAAVLEVRAYAGLLDLNLS